jgi:4a-hydroxytetrahydrobiopterin dehydratase
MPKLSDTEISAALEKLPGWKREGEALLRRFEFPSFADLMIVVNRIAEAAETADHHPDLDIRYNKLTVLLTSHDSGGITRRDVKLAAEISTIAAR